MIIGTARLGLVECLYMVFRLTMHRDKGRW